MCTSVALKDKTLYFGRNLDLEYTFDEAVTIMPRHFDPGFRLCGPSDRPEVRHAVIGMAYTVKGIPLYYDGVNEKGLCMSALNFPGFACYRAKRPGMHNILPCEFIPWILGSCASAAQARQLIARTNLVDIPFSPELPNTPLHWMIAGHDGVIVAEPGHNGLSVYDDPACVLTNSPPFHWHMLNLSQFSALSPDPPENRFAKDLPLNIFSRGMGAAGLPGDLSSPSRFVKAAFAVGNSVCGKGEASAVSQLFHILGSVEHVRGMVRTDSGEYEITHYTCCIDAEKGIYYYTTYDNSRINAVHLRHEDLNGHELIRYPLNRTGDILFRN